MFRKSLLLLILFFSIGINELLPQIIIDTVAVSNYPEVNVDFFNFNKINQPDNNLNVGDVKISNKSVPLLIKNFTNPIQQNIDNLSILLLFDLASDANRFKLYQLFSNSFIDLLSNSTSELSLISFDRYPYIKNYFTTKFTDIKDNIASLKISDMSEIEDAFTLQKGGAVDVAKLGKYQNKAIVIFSDGNKYYDNSKIILLANAAGIPIYTVSVNKIVSKDVIGLFQNTSGAKVDQIDSLNYQDKAKILFAKIFKHQPFSISFDNILGCESVSKIDITNNKTGDKTTFDVNVADTNKPFLEIEPPYLKYGAVMPGGNKTLSVKLTARKKDITITDLVLTSTKFTVENYNHESFVIPKDASKDISIRYNPTDSSIVFALMQIKSDACFGQNLYLNAGFPNKKPETASIKITNPNGGETFVAGDTAEVSWFGVLPNDIIQLQYSTDNMKKWDTLAANITGLKYVWNVVPVYGNQNRVRIIQIWPNNIGETLDLRHKNIVLSANFSNSDDEKHIVTTSNDGIIRLFKSYAGSVVREYKFSNGLAKTAWANFSYDDRLICASYDDGQVVLWNTDDGTINKMINAHVGQVTCVNFSKDNTKIVTSGVDDFIKIWDVNTEKLLSCFDNGTKVWFCKFIANGKKVLFGDGKGRAKVLDIASNSVEKTFSDPSYFFKVNNVEINKDETKVGISQNDGKATVYDYPTGNKLFSVSHEKPGSVNSVVNYIAFGFDSDNSNIELVITSSNDYTAKIWSAKDGKLVNSLEEHANTVSMAVFNFDGSRILTSSIDSSAKIWNLNKRELQIDTSDKNFTIAKAKLIFDTLTFSKTAVSEIRYKEFEKYITNALNGSFPITEMFISGDNKDEFKLLEPFEKYRIKPAESKNISMSFAPNGVGKRTAFLNIVVPRDTIQIPIVGEGYEIGLQVMKHTVDFGDVELGDYKDSLVTAIIKNKSSNEITILDMNPVGANIECFKIIDNKQNITIKPQETHSIKLRFYSYELGKKQGIIQITHNKEKEPIQFLVFGEGVAIDTNSVNISLNDADAKTSEEVNIPISFKVNRTDFNPKDMIAFELEYNPKVAILLSSNNIDIINDTTAKAKLKWSFEDLLANQTIKFKTGMTNYDYSDLKLQNISIISTNKYAVNSKNARLYITNKCVDGNTNQNTAKPKINLAIYPNPTSNVLNITFAHSSITGDAEIVIRDINANIIRNFRLDKATISQDHSIDVSNLNSGVYFISLKTGDGIETQRFDIIK